MQISAMPKCAIGVAIRAGMSADKIHADFVRAAFHAAICDELEALALLRAMTRPASHATRSDDLPLPQTAGRVIAIGRRGHYLSR